MKNKKRKFRSFEGTVTMPVKDIIPVMSSAGYWGTDPNIKVIRLILTADEQNMLKEAFTKGIPAKISSTLLQGTYPMFKIWTIPVGEGNFINASIGVIDQEKQFDLSVYYIGGAVTFDFGASQTVATAPIQDINENQSLVAPPLQLDLGEIGNDLPVTGVTNPFLPEGALNPNQTWWHKLTNSEYFKLFVIAVIIGFFVVYYKRSQGKG